MGFVIINPLIMKIAIFSDIHGNLPAFETMLRHIGKVDQYIFLGDVVDYGPWSNECTSLLMELKNCIRILGNHDQYFINKKYRGEKPLVKKFFSFCLKKFSAFSSLKTFKREYKFNNYIFRHTLNNRYIFRDSKVVLKQNMVIGHSHYMFHTESNGFLLYNAGSVGQNRKYINVINYLLYYPDKGKIEMKNIIYNTNHVINEMKKRKYPEQCINYYLNKKRY